MAIIDKNTKNWFLVDEDENQFIGLTLPLVLDSGELASTKTTLEAVKQNVLNLCSTDAGERVMQPNLGLRLKRFLFQPHSEDLIREIETTIIEGLNEWLPFVRLNDIKVSMSDNQDGDFRSTLEVSVDFSLTKDDSTHESVQITIGE